MRLVVAVLVLLLAAPPAAASGTRVVIHPDRVLGPSNERLTGLAWNTGTLDGVAALEPHQVRIDASLQRVSPAPGVLELDDLLERVAAVRAVGAEPVVILSYMPAWLGDGRVPGRDRTRVAPSDFGTWERLVTDVLRKLVAAGAHRFEVWNEPDLPIFWQDSLPAFLETVRRTHLAVGRVEVETATDLVVGGPATAFPDPAWILPYVEMVRREGLGLDFVSWHYYGNYPFLGPDGAEGTVPEPLHPVMPVWGRRNPATTPRIYGEQTRFVRALIGEGPELWITEWNLSAGGHDIRHDTHEGAAFDAATLIEMERAGLDAADFYRASDDPSDPRPGDWGLVRDDGTPKPAWWVFDAWRRTAGPRLAVTGEDGFWARATRGPGRVDVLLAAFGAEARTVELDVDGACSAEVRLMDESSPDLASSEAVDLPVRVELRAQAVAWVRYATGC